MVCQIADGTLSGEWGGDINHVRYEHTPSSGAAPVLHYFVLCAHRCAFISFVYVHVCASVCVQVSASV